MLGIFLIIFAPLYFWLCDKWFYFNKKEDIKESKLKYIPIEEQMKIVHEKVMKKYENKDM